MLPLIDRLGCRSCLQVSTSTGLRRADHPIWHHLIAGALTTMR
jgi:hypothetical protein